ncbi:MAG: DUF1587 domain-containing protein [Pirellulales bacterium]
MKHAPLPAVLAALFLIVGLGSTDTVYGADPVEDFLAQHCVRCHGPQKGEGDIRFDQLSRDFKSGVDTHHWAEALDKINSGEMPPKKEPQPTQAEIATFVTKLDARLKEGRAARMAARPAVSHYRLSRKEYQNTVYDLLGVRYDPAKPGELNEDSRWHGFERIGSELSLSPSHVDRYYRAAELVLSRASPPRPKKHAKFARPPSIYDTTAERRSRRRSTDSGSSGPCVTCCSPDESRMRCRRIGL